jgi:4-hydroxy-3-polyprenylbenzoate decarboxylase
MVIIPCSMKTLAAVRAGLADGLIGRAADVTLKERRPLVLVPRETPLSDIHLENMLALSRMGVRIVPPMPAFYNHPASVDDVIDHIIARVLDQLGLSAPNARRWTGLKEARDTASARATASSSVPHQ